MLGFPGVSFLTSSTSLSRKTREIGVHKARRRREIGRRWWSLNVTVGVSGENRRQTQGERQKTLDEGTLDRIVVRDGGSTNRDLEAPPATRPAGVRAGRARRGRSLWRKLSIRIRGLPRGTQRSKDTWQGQGHTCYLHSPPALWVSTKPTWEPDGPGVRWCSPHKSAPCWLPPGAQGRTGEVGKWLCKGKSERCSADKNSMCS